MKPNIENALNDRDLSNAPDIILALANLSSDEVFSSPALANRMLDQVPPTLWEDPSTTILDPSAKEGVFLRECAKRFYVGLEKVIPDPQERIDHILKNQLFGIALSPLTALVTRRTLYTNKNARHELSLSRFAAEEGNVFYDGAEHDFGDASGMATCKSCGFRGDAGRTDDRTFHAYTFLHADLPNLFKTLGFPMKFNVIIGNPPYQLADGGHGASAAPIYQHFVTQAMKLDPDHLIMITPSRWFAGGKGLDGFRAQMLNDDRIQSLVDFPDARVVFPDVEIKGGVSFFHWNRDHHGPCEITTVTATGLDQSADKLKLGQNNRAKVVEHHHTTIRALNEYPVFVRWSEALPLLKKVEAVIARDNLKTMDAQVSSRKPFGLPTNVKPNAKGDIILYGSKSIGRYTRANLPQNNEPGGWVDQWKVLAPAAYGAGNSIPHQIGGVCFVAGPGSACSETYNVIGAFDNKDEAQRLARYYATRTFRFLVFLMKNTQHLNKDRYAFVPILPMDRDWTDAELATYFGFTPDDSALIESFIKPMIPVLSPPQPGETVTSLARQAAAMTNEDPSTDNEEPEDE